MPAVPFKSMTFAEPMTLAVGATVPPIVLFDDWIRMPVPLKSSTSIPKMVLATGGEPGLELEDPGASTRPLAKPEIELPLMAMRAFCPKFWDSVVPSIVTGLIIVGNAVVKPIVKVFVAES